LRSCIAHLLHRRSAETPSGVTAPSSVECVREDFREGVVADREDGVLLVQLAQWGSTMGLEEAQQAVLAEGFDPETASADDVLVSRILNWCETIGTLTKNGLLDTDLVLDWVWVSGLWSRVGPAAVKLRQRLGEPKLYENFENLATRQV